MTIIVFEAALSITYDIHNCSTNSVELSPLKVEGASLSDKLRPHDSLSPFFSIKLNQTKYIYISLTANIFLVCFKTFASLRGLVE